MSKSKVFLVAEREYIENLRTKAFWISILMFPVMLSISMIVPRILAKTKDVRRYAVIDQSGDARILDAVLDRADSPDLAKVFGAIWRVKDDAKALKDFGTPPAKLLESMKKLTSEAAARQVGGHYDAIGRPGSPEAAELKKILPEVLDELGAQRDAIRRWWRGLSTAEARAMAPDADRSRYERIDPPTGPDAEAKLKAMIDKDEIFAYFVIGGDPVSSSSGCKYVSNNLTDQDLRSWFTDLVNDEVRERRFREKSIDSETARAILTNVSFEAIQVEKGGKAEKAVGQSDTAHQWAPMAFVYLLWIALMTVANMLLTNTIEEKSNRIIEVLLSSVDPRELMNGKIFGIGATGLTMIFAWIIFFVIEVELGPRLFGWEMSFDLGFILRDPVYLASFALYFLGGYFLFAAVYVGIGSVCNSLKEAQNLMGPVMIIMIVPLMAMMPVSQDPNGALARFLSYIPFLTPFVMMNRAAAPPPMIDYVITSVLLAVTIFLAFRGAAKVFRIGILMTGKPPRLKEIIGWMRAPVTTVAVETERVSAE